MSLIPSPLIHEKPVTFDDVGSSRYNSKSSASSSSGIDGVTNFSTNSLNTTIINDSNSTKIVIIGCGYAGAMVAKEIERVIEKNPKKFSSGKPISLTVIDRHDVCWLKISAIRASVDSNWTERTQIPIAEIIKKGTFIQGSVKSIDRSGKSIKVSSPDKRNIIVSYDILLCASGTLSASPSDLPENVVTSAEAHAYLAGIQNAVANATSIVIVGGGMTSVEFAGEARASYPDKRITIICAASDLLASSIAKPTKTFMKSLHQRLKANRIDVLVRERVMKPSSKDFVDQPFLVGQRTVQCDGKTSAEIEADLVIWAASWKFNNTFYPEDWLNDMGELKIRDTFQLEEEDNIFAFGDISSLLETKQAITLPGKVPTVVDNILNVALAIQKDPNANISRLKLRKYKMSDRALIYLPIGPLDGVSISKLGFTYGGAKTSQWKGKDLFTTKFWNMLTDHDPPGLKST